MDIRITKQTEKIRKSILQLFEKHNKLEFKEIYHFVSKKFSLKEGSIRRHVKALREQGSLAVSRVKNKYVFSLKNIEPFSFELLTKDPLDEMLVWIQKVSPCLQHLSKAAREILEYSFTEMLNNAISHADAKIIKITVITNSNFSIILIHDDGVGIFKKIKTDLKLQDEHQSLLELSKGKFTSDPQNHTGEGIFFTSKACSAFIIKSGSLMYSQNKSEEFGLLEELEENAETKGTTVIFSINNDSSASLNRLFNDFAPAKEDNAFCKTIVPVKLLKYKDEGIVSRSQAKRLLTRFDKFKYVVLDFDGIDSIGQAFADEIFRIFKNNHKDINLTYVNANANIKKMIMHVNKNALC